MPASSQPVQQDRTVTQEEHYALYDREEGVVCHTDNGVVLGESREEAADKLSVVADQLGIATDRLTVVQLTITPVDTASTAADSDEAHDTDETHDTDDADRTTGSLMVTRGPHRQNSKLVEYRQAEDGAWAVKTPEDDEFWIFMRSGTERDVHQHIRAKWDAAYSTSDAFTDQSCPTLDL